MSDAVGPTPSIPEGLPEPRMPGALLDIPAVADTPHAAGRSRAQAGISRVGASRAGASRSAPARAAREPAAVLPVARVVVEVGLAHLDRPFDYLVPTALDEIAQPGVRVRVRFAGQLLDGFILERAEASDRSNLLFLERVVSSLPVLAPDVARLARAIADRYAGTLADVLRLAVPPRHARAETAAMKTPTDVTPPPALEDVEDVERRAAGWAAYPIGSGFVGALGEGRAVRAVWTAVPGEDWPARIAEAVAATVHAGRGALVVVADARDLVRLDEALTRTLGSPDRHVTLSAAAGPEERYGRFVAAVTGRVRVVAGNRAATFAPVADLGLVVIWDDGDDLHAEPRAPYPHAREVLLTRAQQAGAAALVGGFARTAEAAQLIAGGWAREIVAAREVIRARAPRVTAVGDEGRDDTGHARLPTAAWRAARRALADGHPVLVQVPRRGYLPAVACANCRTPARCPACHGPLSLSSAGGQATCRWCARAAVSWGCAKCGGRALRASVIGAGRTAEEIGRAFPGVPVRTSGGDHVLAAVPAEPAVIVTTPGAEPVVEGRDTGYGAVLLLDTWALLSRADLRAGEEALRRWSAAAALALPAERGGTVSIVADGTLAPVQALIRFDPGLPAERDLAERRELGFPPTVRMASLTGSTVAVSDLLSAARLPASADLLGPVPVAGDQERYLVRVPRSEGSALATALRQAQAVRSARKAGEAVRVQIDPLELL